MVKRDVRRIPLKLDFKTAIDANEANHLTASFDGLLHFYPVDIYPENIASHVGLLTAFRRLQLLEGFGLEDHHRFGSYSLHVDVKKFIGTYYDFSTVTLAWLQFVVIIFSVWLACV